MSAIFLSYRRDDSSGYAGRLFDNLAERFGRDRLFMDIETLEPGMDFVAGIDRAVASCGALIAMIGPNWIEARDREGRRRLDDPHDFIRLEIAAALTRDVRVIPVLVHNASMPLEQELPEPLRPLCRLQAFEISDSRWEFDVRRLAKILEPLIAEPAEDQTAAGSAGPAPVGTIDATAMSRHGPAVPASGWLVGLAAAVLLAGGGAWWLSQSTSIGQAKPRVDQPVPSAPDSTAAGQEVRVPSGPPPAPVGAVSPAPPAPPEPPDQTSPEPPPDVATRRVIFAEPREPAPEDPRRREIAELIEAAEVDLERLRLTRPPGNNAFERLQRVLELDPDNPAAHEGLIAISERYHSLVEDALAGDDLQRAQRYLDSAREVEPGADWLPPLQQEIERRQRVVARPDPEPAPRADAAEREACLAACEGRRQACRGEVDRQTVDDCLKSHAEPCEERYQSCMSDHSKLFMGQVSLESECAGVHARCMSAAERDCAGAAQRAEERCETEFGRCVRRCRNQ